MKKIPLIPLPDRGVLSYGYIDDEDELHILDEGRACFGGLTDLMPGKLAKYFVFCVARATERSDGPSEHAAEYIRWLRYESNFKHLYKGALFGRVRDLLSHRNVILPTHNPTNATVFSAVAMRMIWEQPSIITYWKMWKELGLEPHDALVMAHLWNPRNNKRLYPACFMHLLWENRNFNFNIFRCMRESDFHLSEHTFRQRPGIRWNSFSYAPGGGERTPHDRGTFSELAACATTPANAANYLRERNIIL